MRYRSDYPVESEADDARGLRSPEPAGDGTDSAGDVVNAADTSGMAPRDDAADTTPIDTATDATRNSAADNPSDGSADGADDGAGGSTDEPPLWRTADDHVLHLPPAVVERIVNVVGPPAYRRRPAAPPRVATRQRR